jgi:hypothetical protein
MHLQIAAILLDGRAVKGGIPEHPPHFRAAQEV